MAHGRELSPGVSPTVKAERMTDGLPKAASSVWSSSDGGAETVILEGSVGMRGVREGVDMARRSIYVGAALVTALILGGAPQGVALAAEEPDLQVKYVGLQANSKRVVQFEVKNISAWWAKPTTADVVVTPAQGTVPPITIGELDPNQTRTFTFTLASDCDGHKVAVNVVAAKNYADVDETNLKNNSIPSTQVCPPKSPSNPPAKPDGEGGIVKDLPGANVLVGPDLSESGVVKQPTGIDASALRPAAQTLILKLDPVAHWSAQHTVSSGPGSFAPGMSGDDFKVGWGQHESALIGYWTSRVQLAVNFDLAQLDGIKGKDGFFSEALLTWKENRLGYESGAGEPIAWPGCMDTVGFATAPWEGLNLNQIPNEYVNDFDPAARAVNVLPFLTRQLQSPSDQSLRLGYVLRGGPEELTGDDDTKCYSTLESVQLHVTVAVR